MKARLLLICLLILNTACGFHLRGSQSTNFNVANVYIQPSSAPKLSKEVTSQLTGAGVVIAKSTENAAYIITLKEEVFERSVLSVNADTGKVEEFQIVFNAKMDAMNIDGTSIVKNDLIRSSGDLTFDENAVLGKFSEETILQEEIVRQAAAQVLRRLQALLTKNQ